jgi:hypothetical protein
VASNTASNGAFKQEDFRIKQTRRQAWISRTDRGCGNRMFIDHGAGIPLLAEKPGGAQAGEARADNGDPSRLLRRQDRQPRLAGRPFGVDGMAYEVGNGHGLVVFGPAAAVFARALADPAEDPGKREVAPGGCGGQPWFPGAHVLEHRRNPEMGRADPLARRQAITEVVAE